MVSTLANLWHVIPGTTEAEQGDRSRAAAGNPAATVDVGLTRREREVLRLLCHRLTDQEIARHLCISIRTAECHVASILDKLDAANRREAARIALTCGLA